MNQDMSVVGIDIAKRVFHVIGADGSLLPQRLSRQPTPGGGSGIQTWGRDMYEVTLP